MSGISIFSLCDSLEIFLSILYPICHKSTVPFISNCSVYYNIVIDAIYLLVHVGT